MEESTRAVYYATDDNPFCLYRLRKSIQSLRQYNQKVTVYLGYFGKLHEEDRLFFQKHNVTLIYNPDKCNPYLARYLILENGFPESELAYLDTDTIVFSDIEELFEKTGPEDFHAREAPMTMRSGYPYRSGCSVIPEPIMNHELYDSICESLNAKVLPIFNIGVMVFKNRFHERLQSYAEQLGLLISMFKNKRLPYPCTNPHVSDEVATSLVLGSIPDLSWNCIEPSVATFYYEFRCNDTGTGVVMHVLSLSYTTYLLDFASREEAELYMRTQFSMKFGWKMRMRVRWMLWGGLKSRSTFFRKLRKRWIQFGVWLYKLHLKKESSKVTQHAKLNSEAA